MLFYFLISMEKKSDPNQIFEDLTKRVERAAKPVESIYRILAARLGVGEFEPALQMLMLLATPEQARLVEALPDPSRPESAGRGLDVSEKFAECLGMSKETAEMHIRELYEKGLIFPTKKGPQMARTFIQLKDATLGNPKFDGLNGTAYLDLWALLEGPMKKPLLSEMMEHPEMRIVPRWRSIENVPGVMPFEDTRTILKSHDTIALIPCGCKRSHIERWCGIPTESCIALGRTAEYNLERGVGKRLTYEQAVELLNEFDERPTVHTTVNRRDVNQLICNCHYCCCASVRLAGKSRFIAENKAEDCTSCGDCVDKCQYDAITMKTYPGIDGEIAYVDPDTCRGCGSCVVTCTASSLTMKVVRPIEHIPENFSIY